LLRLSQRRLALSATVTLASALGTGGGAHALLDHGANFSIVVPVNVAIPVGICSAQSIGSSNNALHGKDFHHNDALSNSRSESNCAVLNNLLRNVSNALNGNFVGNLTGNMAGNLNDALSHNLNGNLLGLFEDGALVSL
jgi:hypothetical protein